MGLPKQVKQTAKFKFIELPEEVWRVQLLPPRIPLPTNVLYPGLQGGFKYEKVFDFIREYLDESDDLKDIQFFETALKVYEAGSKGIQLHRADKYDDAIEHYEKALKLEPGSWICRYNLSYCHFQLGESKEAFDAIMKAIDCYALEPRNYALLGDIFVQEKKYTQAYGAYHQFLRQARVKGSFSNVTFQLRYQLGLLEDRDEKLKLTLPFPFDARCVCGASWSFPKTCPGSKGHKHQPHSFKDSRYPRVSDWHLATQLECSTCKTTVKEFKCPECERLYHWGVGTLKTFHPVDPTASIQDSYFDFGGEDKRSKSYVESVLQETAFALLEFRYQDALNSLYKASRIVFDEPIYHYKLVEVLKLMGREVEGVKHYENILKSYPDSVHARYGLALLSPNAERSIKLFQEIIHLEPRFAPAYNAIGDLLIEEGQTEEALTYFYRSMDIDFQWIPVYRSLAMLFQGVGEEYLSIHYRNVLHRMAPYFDDRHENSYIAFAGRLQNQREFDRANQVLTSIGEIAKAAVTNDEQRVHYELGFEPWLKVKKIRNHLNMGDTKIAEQLMGQLTSAIEEAEFTDDTGAPADLRLNLVKTLIDEGLATEARSYLDSKRADEELDPVAVEWLKNYERDKVKHHRICCGDKTVKIRDVARFAVRALVEIRSPAPGIGVLIDPEGLLVVPSKCVEGQEEVEVLTYDGLWMSARVIVRSARAPFAILKVPPLSEGTYFHIDLYQIPVLARESPVIAVGSNETDDFMGAEAHVQQDFVDSKGVRFLMMDRDISAKHGCAVVLTQTGAMLGVMLPVEGADTRIQSRLTLDSDEILQLVAGIKKHYPFIYRAHYCRNCGTIRREDQRVCACGYEDTSEDIDGPTDTET